MKQLITVFLLALCLFTLQQNAYAQPKQGFTFRQNWYNYTTPLRDDWNFKDIFTEANTRGVEFGYNHRISGNTWFVAPFKAGLIRSTSREPLLERNRTLLNLDALIQHNFFRYGNLINPYLQLGVGSTYNGLEKDFDLNIPAGVGLNFRIFENFYANIQSQYRFSMQNRNSWHHGVGGVAYFGDAAEEKPKKLVDTDNDGFPDMTDKCPTVPGVASASGCPDRDGDSVADADDKCPDAPGLPELAGCADRDADGIADPDDACPDAKGTAAFAGCPDTDSDGIADNNDKCPKEAGPASNQGCPLPDRDGDGVLDRDDACPDAKGTAATKGCPDRDGDSIADRDDACPDKRGTAAGKGCPDSDGDSVYDNEDRCPDKAGPVANKGCPEIKVEDKAKLERAVKLVQFETGKAVLLKKSYAILDEVISVMKTYPEYSLNINGHTDNQGDDKLNQQLSERRAKACYDYLVSKGADVSKISSQGFGETKPVADNATAAGREKNRRVEFELYVK